MLSFRSAVIVSFSYRRQHFSALNTLVYRGIETRFLFSLGPSLIVRVVPIDES
jgi:hypothetical protein